MNHPIRILRSACAGLLFYAASAVLAAPVITPGPVVELCGGTCDPVGGVGLAGNQLGFLVDEAGVATWIVIDRTTGNEISSTPLGAGAGVEMTDIASDMSGGAWLVGFSDVGGFSTPGRWHSADVLSRDTPLGIGGTADLLLTSVISDGTAFGVSATDFATRILPDGSAIDMTVGLTTELPTSISDSVDDGSAAVGEAQLGGALTLAVWSGDLLGFQDTVPGGNGVIGRRGDGSLVIVGVRIGATGAQLGAIVDPLGIPALTTLTSISSGELNGMDAYDFGYAYGAVEDAPAVIDTNDMEIIPLSDAGISGFESLVSMDYLGGNDWLLVLRGSAHYVIASITIGGADSDADGVPDGTDNCMLTVNPGQEDANGDLIGNLCDADFNDDCIVNAVDLGILRLNFFTANPVIDLNSDGIVNVLDLGLLKTLFFQPPGPGATGNACE